MIALIPAHNEARNICRALTSLREQTLPVDRVIVVCDNCTDTTEALAETMDAEVFVTQGNTAKKAGALNQALDWYAPDEHVLIMDADSALDPTFVEAAQAKLDADPGLGGISGTFRGSAGGGYVGMAQRNEYARYARDVRRLKGKALVLTGTAAIFRAETLRAVREARQKGSLPPGAGVYDEKVLTEDNELTLALLHLGWRILAPRECTLVTEVMDSWGDLGRQRLRWKRGALENIRDYGFTRITMPYWGRQFLSLLSVIATVLYLCTLSATIALGTFHWQPFWVGITSIFVLERAITVRDRGLKQQLLAALLIFEMPFDFYLQGVQAYAFINVLFNRTANW